MSETQQVAEHEQLQNVSVARPKSSLSLPPTPKSATATDPPAQPGDIVTTIVLKPGVKITIEYPK